MKTCQDCRYVYVVVDEGVDGHSLYAKCHHPRAFVEIRDFYNGKTKTLAMSIEHMRMLGPCGMDGDLFEPKDT